MTDSEWNQSSQDPRSVDLRSKANVVFASTTLQEGTAEDDILWGATALDEGSTILVGYTNGNWTGDSVNNTRDFVAVKLDVDGAVQWHWQVRRVSLRPL